MGCVWCVVWPGPRAVWRDLGRTHLLGLRGRTRPLRQSPAIGPWGQEGAALGGGPRGEGSHAGARSIATKYKHLVEEELNKKQSGCDKWSANGNGVNVFVFVGV